MRESVILESLEAKDTPIEEEQDAQCRGCGELIEEGSVVSFGDGIWHIDCFRCAKCRQIVECDSNLLLLSNGSPICENCSYNCRSCGKSIQDAAIMTGEDAYHADCFRCIVCENQIEDLVFTQTSKGIYCTVCYAKKKEEKLRRAEEKERMTEKTKPLHKRREKELTNLPLSKSGHIPSPSPSPHSTKIRESIPWANILGSPSSSPLRSPIRSPVGSPNSALQSPKSKRKSAILSETQLSNMHQLDDFDLKRSTSGRSRYGDTRAVPSSKKISEFLTQRPQTRRDYHMGMVPSTSDENSPILSGDRYESSHANESDQNDSPGYQSEDGNHNITKHTKFASLPKSPKPSSDGTSVAATAAGVASKERRQLTISSTTSNFVSRYIDLPQGTRTPKTSMFFSFDESINTFDRLSRLLDLSFDYGENTADSARADKRRSRYIGAGFPGASFNVNTPVPNSPTGSDRIAGWRSSISSHSSLSNVQPPTASPKRFSMSMIGFSLNKSTTEIRAPPLYQDDSVLSTPNTPGPVDASALPDDIPQLKHEIISLRNKLNEAETNFEKIKAVGRKAVEEFECVKNEFSNEVALRQQAEQMVLRLKSELQAIQLERDEYGYDGVRMEVEHMRAEHTKISSSVENLRRQRDAISRELQELLTGRDSEFSDSAQDQLKAFYLSELRTLMAERDTILQEIEWRRKTRDELDHEILVLRQKNEDILQLNRDLYERLDSQSSISSNQSTFYGRKSNEQFQRVGTLQRFNSISQAKFKWKKARDAMKGMTKPLLQPQPQQLQYLPPLQEQVHQPSYQEKPPQRDRAVDHGQHQFNPTSFLRRVKCEVCGDKLWGLAEYRCAVCGMPVHAKCVRRAPTTCVVSKNSAKELESAKSGVFGCELTLLVGSGTEDVPLVLRRCIEAVERRGMDFEGIYRKSGGSSSVKSMQLAFDNGEDPDLNDPNLDVCVVASVLKTFLRMLPQPLLTFELYTQFIDATRIEDEEKQLETFRNLIQQLPPVNYKTFRYLMLHLDRVQKLSEINLMSPKNLSVVFGPTLMWDSESARDLADINRKNKAVEYIIQHVDELFASTQAQQQQKEENSVRSTSPADSGTAIRKRTEGDFTNEDMSVDDRSQRDGGGGGGGPVRARNDAYI
ncbi:uncharacterized protein VTP21DRAFT_8559 [Calcarisporiella thermophila]|uniref:uncharacterized protein n=1 Tax=Calcarisporiella thermophila TaxID=911321 RepID=UPI0037446A8F